MAQKQKTFFSNGNYGYMPTPEAHIIKFKSPYFKQVVFFKAFLTNISDTATASWQEDTVYGRVDPVYSYASTKRNIAFGIDIPCQDLYEAKEALNRLEYLRRFIYPKYSQIKDLEADTIYSISGSPLVGIYFPPYIGEIIDNIGNDTIYDYLWGVVDNVAITPIMEEGFMFGGKTNQSINSPKHQVPLAKAYKLSINFKVVHREFENNIGSKKQKGLDQFNYIRPSLNGYLRGKKR